jgi:diguanylate cyclase (GGDEF)-like protein
MDAETGTASETGGGGQREGTRRIARLSASIIVVAALLWALLLHRVPAPVAARFAPAVVLAALVVLAELCTVHVHIRRETHTVSLREIPLVIALLTVSPLTCLATYLAGSALALVVRTRLPLIKFAFNVSMLVLDVALAGVVFRLVAGDAHLQDPQVWLAAIAAAVVIDVVGGLLVGLAIWLFQGEYDGRQVGWLTLTGALAAVANASFALVAVLLASVAPAATALLAGIGAMMFAAYRAYASLRRRHADLEVLQEYTAALGRTFAFEEVALTALREARDKVGAERAELWFLPSDEDVVGVRMNIGADDRSDVDWRFRLPVTGALWGQLVAGTEPVVVRRNERRPHLRELLGTFGCKDLVATPLESERGVVGALLLCDRLGDVASFERADGQLLAALGRYTSIALENGRLVDELQREASRRAHEALHDPLTGLPNRRWFVEHAPEMLSRVPAERSAATLLLDLDGFKDVNDTFGHSSGDVVLLDVATRIRRAVPDNATVARLGGDEFAVLVRDIGSPAEAHQLAAQVQQAVRLPFVVNGVTLHLDVSAGIALYPEHGEDPTTLLRCADIAMYGAKDQRVASALYSPAQDPHTPERIALAADLRAAISGGTFALGYQPTKDLRTGEITGVEALARWEHPTQGFLSPPTYISVAEQSDLICVLTQYVLTTALDQRREWHDSGLDLRMGVNVSVHDLRRPDFTADVARALEATRTPRERLVLEITETQALHDPERIRPVLLALRELGVIISIDDFGTGYSSLTSLRSLPVDEIKIDRSFVSGMTANDHDNAIVRSMIELARRLRLHVVAEGVEDEATEQQLFELGCRHIQGYVLARAMNADALYAWAREYARSPVPATVTGPTSAVVPLPMRRPA